MKLPQTYSEKLMYSTIMISTSDGTGTGFIFLFNIDNENIPVIITNKHVVNYKNTENVYITFHTKSEKEPNVTENLKCEFTIDWIFHENKDLCYCYLQPVVDFVLEKTGKEVFFTYITEEIILNEHQLEDLNAIEDVIMVGYPNGLIDETNNLPIFRRGITSSHPAYDFNENGIGLLDMACFPGSSGSPIFIYDTNGYSDNKGNIYLGSSRIIFLGILFSGPVYNSLGEVQTIDIPTVQKSIASFQNMLNLGYYIKAYELLAFKKQIKRDLLKDKEMMK